MEPPLRRKAARPAALTPFVTALVPFDTDPLRRASLVG
jgi:hypothetical protein